MAHVWSPYSSVPNEEWSWKSAVGGRKMGGKAAGESRRGSRLGSGGRGSTQRRQQLRSWRGSTTKGHLEEVVPHLVHHDHGGALQQRMAGGRAIDGRTAGREGGNREWGNGGQQAGQAAASGAQGRGDSSCRHVAKHRKSGSTKHASPTSRPRSRRGTQSCRRSRCRPGPPSRTGRLGSGTPCQARKSRSVCISSRHYTRQCHLQQLGDRSHCTATPMHPVQLPDAVCQFVQYLTCSGRCPRGRPGPAGAHWRRLPSLRRASLFPWRVHLSSKWSALGLYAFPTTPLATGCADRPAQPRPLIHCISPKAYR